MSKDQERALLAKLVYESVRFANWAAGQGICPVEGEPAMSPEDFLFEYSTALDIDDWDGLEVVARDAILAGASTYTNGERDNG